MEQTNRTILFEEINPEKKNILSIIGDEEQAQSLTDEVVEEINKNLMATSFQEFTEKFDPQITMYLDTNRLAIEFSQPDTAYTTHKFSLLAKDSVFNRIIDMMEARRLKKYDFVRFEDLCDNMIPVEGVEQMIEERNNIVRNVVSPYFSASKVRREILRFMNTYDSGVLLLKGYLKDVENLFLYREGKTMIDRGVSNTDASMQIHMIQMADAYSKVTPAMTNEQVVLYREALHEVWEDAESHSNVCNHVLMLNFLMIPIEYNSKKFGDMAEKYNTYLDFYVTMLKRFWINTKPVIETLLGIREFFLQYGDMKEPSAMKPSLLIVNCKISDIIREKNLKKLEVYLNTVNFKNYTQNTIWFAIVPNMSTPEGAQSNKVRERFMGSNKAEQYFHNEPTEIALLLDYLGRYRVQSFLSMALLAENSFTYFFHNGIEGINESLRPLDKMENADYLIPCFPNFCVVPKEQTGILAGIDFKYDDWEEKIQILNKRKVWLDWIGVEASYVAAGLYAASRCPYYLAKHYKRGVNLSLPGVSYRLTQGNHAEITATGMLRETLDMPEELMRQSLNESRGVFFNVVNGRIVVLTERAFSHRHSNNLLVPMVQTMSYVERTVQRQTQDFKKNLITRFFERRPESIISTWYDYENNSINSILQRDEELLYTIDEKNNDCVLKINFKNENIVKEEKVSIIKE